jgi:hypothetical protein
MFSCDKRTKIIAEWGKGWKTMKVWNIYSFGRLMTGCPWDGK